MRQIIGLVVCVNYDDLLAVTLPAAMRHLDCCYVVTSYEDESTHSLCRKTPCVHHFVTDAFTADGAIFNKGRAIEELINQHIRKIEDAIVIIFDADCVFPSSMNIRDLHLDRNTLYGAHRRMLTNYSQFIVETESVWSRLELSRDVEFAGYFQLFNTSADCLKDAEYWYDPTFTHAGGGDAHFQSLFSRKHRLPVEVLHIGERDRNWFGRVTRRIDGKPIDREQAIQRGSLMQRLRLFQGWVKGVRRDMRDRIRVPGVVSRYIWGKSKPPE